MFFFIFIFKEVSSMYLSYLYLYLYKEVSSAYLVNSISSTSEIRSDCSFTKSSLFREPERSAPKRYRTRPDVEAFFINSSELVFTFDTRARTCTNS